MDKIIENENVAYSLENQETQIIEMVSEGETVEVEVEAAPPVKKKKNILLRLLNVAAFLLLMFVIFETVIAFLNFNLIQKNEEPRYFVEKSFEEEGEDIDYTIWNMGLYKIVRKDTPKNYEIRLLPFFLDM